MKSFPNEAANSENNQAVRVGSDEKPSWQHQPIHSMTVEQQLAYALEECLEHIEWMRARKGQQAGPNDCTHRAKAALARLKYND